MLFLWWSLGKTHKIFPTEASLPLYRNCSPFDRTRTHIRISPTPGFGFKLLSPLDETKVLEDSLKGPAAKLARVRILRACVLLALMLATALLGCFSYTTFAEADQVSFQDQFSASANLIKERLMSSFQIVRDSALEQSSLYTYEFQDEKQWPNITMSGFNEIMNSRLQLVNGRAINFVAVLDSRINRKSWEAYAAATYPSLDLPQSVRDVLAAWPPSKGIYNEPVDSDIKVYSPTPQLSSIYPYLLAPAWQVVPVNTAIIIMQNEHSPGPRMIAIDQAVQSLKPALSDFVVLYSDVNIFRPSSIVYVPIISMTNESKVLGLTNLVYSWDILMSGSLPSYIGGVECVIKSSSSGNSFTFGISGSNVTIKSTGDTHDTRYDNLVSRFSIQIDAAQEYTIFLYPTSKLQDSYQSSTPLMSLLVIICGIGTVDFLILYTVVH